MMKQIYSVLSNYSMNHDNFLKNSRLTKYLIAAVLIGTSSNLHDQNLVTWPPLPLQLQLQSFSPSLKGQDQNTSRYGVFSQQPPSRSRPDNKENMPEVLGLFFFFYIYILLLILYFWYKPAASFKNYNEKYWRAARPNTAPQKEDKWQQHWCP